MFIIQLGIITSTFIFLSALIMLLTKHFQRVDIAHYFIAPLLLYSLGFILRLTQYDWLVDLGYFFTEGTFLFVYSIFSITFLLGQLRYWKK